MSNMNALYNLNDSPLFTYGMIGITTFVLAVVTMMDTDNNSFAKDDGYEKTSSEESNQSIFGNMFASQSKPVETESKPVEEESKPVEEESKPVETESKPVETESKPVEEESKPVEEESKEQSMLGNMFTSDNKPIEQKGGKYKHRKTKHNKRQNTYTRKR